MLAAFSVPPTMAAMMQTMPIFASVMSISPPPYISHATARGHIIRANVGRPARAGLGYG